MLGLTSTTAYGRDRDRTAAAAAQVLTWTASSRTDQYASFPTTAVAGPATLVFENSTATGNDIGMPHTLTFDVSDPEYNHDVPVNILANPGDDSGGKHTVDVTLTPGRYRYFCGIPGHGQMQGILTVTEPGGEDTTAPTAAAKVEGQKNADGAYVGSATVTVSASDDASGVKSIEYAVGEDGPWQAYTAPVVVDQVGTHTLRYRATDKAGNVAAEKSVTFSVVAPPTDDTTAPETSATVSGEKDADGNYLTMATVTVTASDTGSGVNTIEYALGSDGAWQPYTAPVMVHEVGTHTVRYRATDKAGNATAAKSVTFTVVAPPAQDTTAPETSATLSGTRNSGGAYVTSAKVTVNASDSASGVARVEYSLDGGAYLEYSAPVEESRPEWVAINYGHEIQILDSPTGDMYKTGSVYGFDRVGLGGAGVTPKGTWNDYEIRAEGQHFTILRNGVVINEFDNVGGQVFTPPRAGDPGTDGRRYATGYIGLQVHSTSDVISYRDIRIKEL
ncbi:OmpL47-type beta-barrel domain-containing protein [Streptomyces sp. NPDC091385]|uniref:OmpL47-type beta-barrel domain-containing protein n=1 Tax=Streptomyces sp. NPDC091385 TaxID=3365997 RepID=UPI003803F152